MPGIIHFDRLSRRQRPVTRRSLMIGTAGYAGAAALGVVSVAGQESATPRATPGEVKGPEMGLFKGKARARLKGLLSLVPPDYLGGPDPNTPLFSWLDLQTHLVALGNPDLSDTKTPVTSITGALVASDPLFRYSTSPEAIETFGFSSLEIHQTLVAGTPPNQVTFYAGGAPVDQLPTIWEAAGYEHKQGEVGEYWTAGEDGELNLESPISGIGLGLLNNVAIVEDEIIVFAPRSELLQAVQRLAKEGGESAADLGDVATLLGTMPERAVNVIAIPGGGLNVETITPENPGAPVRASLMDLLAESDDAVGPMPISTMGFFGITAGALGDAPDAGTPVSQVGGDAFMFVDMLLDSPEDAMQAEKVVTWRMEHMVSPTTGYAYSELLTPDASARQETSGPVATLAFTSPVSLAVWTRMVMTQDLWPFVYLPEE